MRDERAERAQPRRRGRRRAIGDLMGFTTLGGLAAAVIGCIVRWDVVSSGQLIPTSHPLVLSVLSAAAGAALGLGLAGPIAYPLYRTYGPDSGTARLLSFTAGMLAVPVAALGVLLWVRVAG